jgi:mRNA interferase RelE/StbE
LSSIPQVAQVKITPDAMEQVDQLPKPTQGRVRNVLVRLSAWPAVSGAKPLRGRLSGSFRIRTGDYRVIFTYTKGDDSVVVWKIGYRGGIYDEERRT